MNLLDQYPDTILEDTLEYLRKKLEWYSEDNHQQILETLYYMEYIKIELKVRELEKELEKKWFTSNILSSRSYNITWGGFKENPKIRHHSQINSIVVKIISFSYMLKNLRVARVTETRRGDVKRWESDKPKTKKII